ncbi:MAG: hypothetical protein U1E65_19975 [Myxococcota bacterium]
MISTLLLLALGAPPSCRELYTALKYGEAVEACRQAIPSTPRAALPELYRLLGLSAAAGGDEATALLAFEGLVLLDPAAGVSEAYAPRIRAIFERARQLAKDPIRLSAAATPVNDGQPIPLRLELEDGPAQPLRALSVDGGAALPRLSSAFTLELPASTEPGSRTLSVSGYDALGGLVFQQAVSIEIRRLEGRPPVLSPWLWLGASATLGGTGALLGGLAQHSHQQAVDAVYADDAVTIQGRAEREAIAADVCFGVAGALLLGSIALLLTE